MKKRFANELARELAYTGPQLLKLKFDQYFYSPALSYFNGDRLPKGSLVILIRGPLPCGEHKTSEGGRLWFITPKGPRYQEIYSYVHSNLDHYFERI